VAEHTGLAESTLGRMARKGMISAVKLGQKWRIKRDLFDRWLEEHLLRELAEFE
jgi:excisionase family DNA binding protein